MKTKFRILFGLAVAMALGLSALAYQQGACGDGHGFRGKRAEFGRRLGLTDAQKTQMNNIWLAHKPEVAPLAQQFAAERRTLRELIHATTVDDAAIRTEVAKMAGIGANLAVARAHLAHDMRAVLTPEQTAKINTMKEGVDTRIDRFLEHMAERTENAEENN